MTAVHVIAPEGIGDPRRPSGGNTFDLRICRGLAEAAWTVHLHEVAGAAALRDAVARIPDGAVVLVDGLVASPASDVLVPQAGRVRLVVLLHVLSGDDEREGAVLAAAAAVVTTSAWTRRAVLERYGLPEHSVRVAEPGVDAAELAPGTETAGALLSVGAVTRVKGHDVLVDALAALTDRRWHCLCVGSLDREQAFAARVHGRVADSGLHGRVRFAGPQVGAVLARSYGGADVLVLPSRAETYGMVVTEALARGLPVIAADVGGVPEALGHGASGARPGLLVPPDDPAALREALQAWLEDAGLRRRLRLAARERRASLPSWSTTTSVLAGVLAEAAA